MSRTAVAAYLVLTLPQASFAAGQRAAAPEFGSAITIVTLPVFVTGKDAQAVVGLTQDDFEVLDDGRPVKVVGFRELDAAEPGPDLEAVSSPAARRQFLLLFDLSFSSMSGLVRARQAALGFIESGLQPADLAAVATLSASRGVKLVVGFTSDRTQLKRAVSGLGMLKPDRKTDPLGLVYDLTEIGAAYADTALDDSRRLEFDDTVRQIQQRYQMAEKIEHRQRILGVLDGLGQLARALDGLQGRKQVVLLSSGFDATPIQGEQPQEAAATSDAVTRGRLWEVRSEDRFGDTGVRNEMEQALRHFASSDAVVHAVDLSGLAARGDARFQSREPVRASGQESLARIAGASGGRLFKSTNDVDRALREVLELSRHYYLLAFEPQDAKGPGHFHKLKVRVKGKGRDVSHRSGYFERAPYKDRPALTRQFEAAELIAKGGVKGEIDVRALAIPYGGAAGKVTLPVVLEVEGDSLLGRTPKERLGLEIYGYAIGDDGGVLDLVGLLSNLDVGKVAARLRKGGLQCHATFTLAPGRYSLRFLVRDAESGRSGSYWLEVNIPAFDSGQVLLFPPMFMDDPERWLVLEAHSRGTAEPAASPFRVASEAFAPRARPRLGNGKPASVCLLAFDGGIAYDPGASFEIKTALLDAAGDPVPIGRIQLAKSVAEGDGFRRFVLSFTPEDVAAGDYTLRVRLRDPASGRISEAYQAVRFE